MPLRRDELEKLPTGRHPDGEGLYLQVTKSGSRAWLLRFRLYGQERQMGLGALKRLSLAEARRQARDILAEVRQGIDPIAKRRAERAVPAAPELPVTFQEAARAYIAVHSVGWSAKHARQWEQSLADYAFPLIGTQPVSAITVAEVEWVLRPIWHVKHETAKRVRQRLEKVLDRAAAQLIRTGENPARRELVEQIMGRPRLTRTNFPAMPYRQVPAFMRVLRAEIRPDHSGVAAAALAFLILTAARAGEVLGATWGEIDPEERVWTIPAWRMKADKEHRVPLTPSAIAIVGSQRAGEEDELIFRQASGRPLGTRMLIEVIRRLAERHDQPDWRTATSHGFRSSFRDFAAERMPDVPEVVAEMALAHSVGSAVVRAYRRTDLLAFRAQLAQAWSDFVDAGGGTPAPQRKHLRAVG